MGKRVVNQNVLKQFIAHHSDLKVYIGSVIRDCCLRDDVFQDNALTLWETFTPDRPFPLEDRKPRAVDWAIARISARSNSISKSNLQPSYRITPSTPNICEFGTELPKASYWSNVHTTFFVSGPCPPFDSLPKIGTAYSHISLPSLSYSRHLPSFSWQAR
jgi:hypothetical protein